ncbi:MAG TPA: hypothetical protein VF735_05855 [Pyrinomonadaceae bacterium]|jgi:hypothetical protein
MLAKVIYLSLIYQNSANQNQNSISQNLNFWLVMAGILIIFICLIAMFVPNVKALITRPQEFNGLGVSMKVSVLTVFVVMGFVLSLSSFALQWQGYVSREIEYKNKIGVLETERNELRERETRGRKFNMSIVLKPKGMDEVLNTDEWSCVYYLEDSSGKPSEPKPTPLFRAKDGKSFKITLEDITPETRLYSIELKKGKKLWTVDSVFPLREGTFLAEPEEEDEESDS